MKVNFVQMHRLGVLFSTLFVGILLGYVLHAQWPFAAIRSFAVAMQILNALHGFAVLDFHLTNHVCAANPILLVPTFVMLGFVCVMYCYALSNVVSWLGLWGKSMSSISIPFHVGDETVVFTASEIMIMCVGWVSVTIVSFVVNSYFIFVRPFSNK